MRGSLTLSLAGRDRLRERQIIDYEEEDDHENASPNRHVAVPQGSSHSSRILILRGYLEKGLMESETLLVRLLSEAAHIEAQESCEETEDYWFEVDRELEAGERSQGFEYECCCESC